MVQYYSSITKEFYDSEKATIEAERAFLKAKEEKENEEKKHSELRKARAAEVEAAREEFLTARKKYNELLTKFCSDYGSYHYSIKDGSMIDDLFSILGIF